MPEIVITLDIGGSGVKASCFDPAGDVATTAAVVPYPPADPGDEGVFDPCAWAGTAIAALAQLVARCPAQPRHYLGITVSAIRIPFVLLDAGQQVVGPSLLNRDRRALPIVGDLVSSIGHRELHSTTGHWAAPEFGLPKLIWIQRSYPDSWQRVRTILQLHDWFIFSLCGAIASEASSAAMSQMMDISAGTWAFDLLASECGVRSEMMPEFAAAGTRAGGLLRTVAEQVGLPAGLPVHLGAGDTHMSALAAGSQAPGCPIVVAGTTGPAQLPVEAAADLGAWFPLLVSALPAAPGWALEANAGPTGEIADRLTGLTELSGAGLRAALAARGFAVEENADHSGHLTVLAGNPFFGPRRLACLASADRLRPHGAADRRRRPGRSQAGHMPGVQPDPGAALQRGRVPRREGHRHGRDEPERRLEPGTGRRDRPHRSCARPGSGVRASGGGARRRDQHHLRAR